MKDEKEDPIAKAMGMSIEPYSPCAEEIKLPDHNNPDELQHERDHEYARTTLYDMIEKTKKAYDDLSRMAASSGGDDKLYNALANMIKTSTSATKTLVDLHKNREIKKDPQNVTNQNLIITTAELLAAIEQRKKNEK